MPDFRFDTMNTPVGQVTLVAVEEGLAAVLWEEEREGRVRFPKVPRRDERDPVLVQTKQQLKEYFAGKRREFDLPLSPLGTPFQKQAWEALRRIPYGSTATYAEQARDMGQSGKARAVGAANGRNPLSIVVPCHRVIGKNGSLTGFAGGLKAKQFLLALESDVRRKRESR